MILIVGLGNPGKKYIKTRHNIGRLAVSDWQQAADFSNFRFEKKFNTLISQRIFDKNEIILALPETFMNLSGKSTKSLTVNYKIPTNNFLVVHDDIDLPLGKVRIVKNRGAGGHKGVESIIHELKTKNFIRIRIGVQPKSGKPKNVESFVLQKFTKEEKKIVKEVIEKATEAIKMILKQGLKKAMNKFNK